MKDKESKGAYTNNKGDKALQGTSTFSTFIELEIMRNINERYGETSDQLLVVIPFWLPQKEISQNGFSPSLAAKI